MPSPDPAVPADPATPIDPARLLAWLGEHHGSDVAIAAFSLPAQAGFDSDIAFVRLEGAGLSAEWRDELVLRIAPSAERDEGARREAAVHEWLIGLGYPAPRILAVIDPGVASPGPVQVMQRAPGVSMLDAATRRPWRFGVLLDRFAGLHHQLHTLSLDDVPTDVDVVERRLRLPRRVAAELDPVGIRDGIAAMEALTDRLRDAPPALCHGDFHPLNVLVDPSGTTIIDWTDAGIGDRHCDIARTRALFDLAAIVASNPVERRVLGAVGPRLGGSYLRRYDRLSPVDTSRVILWTPLHALHDWSQALAGSDRAAAMPAVLADTLRVRFERSVAAARA